MWDAIAALEKVGHIWKIHDGRWLFKDLLAPKPHHEHVHDIDRQVCLALLRQLHPAELSDPDNCLPNPTLRFDN
jgi:hypothetical protein